MALYEWLSEVETPVYLFSDTLTIEMITGAKPDMIVSYNYRHIISSDILEFMAGRAVNLHISLLPWNRGASPNLFSFLESTPSGVTIHQLSPGLDTGDILLQQEIRFDYEAETLRSSYQKLHLTIQRLFRENWHAIRAGSITPIKQTGKATYHRAAELERYRDAIDYNDTIAEFLRKAVRCSSQ